LVYCIHSVIWSFSKSGIRSLHISGYLKLLKITVAYAFTVHYIFFSEGLQIKNHAH
jgi:hypothetical protein